MFGKVLNKLLNNSFHRTQENIEIKGIISTKWINPFKHNVAKCLNVLSKSASVHTTRFLKYVCPFFKIMSKRINFFMTEALSYRKQPIELLCKSMAWFLYDRDLRHEIVKSHLLQVIVFSCGLLKKKLVGGRNSSNSMKNVITNKSVPSLC